MQVPFFLPSGYGVAEGNGATAPSPMKGLFSGAKRQPRSITRRFEKKGAAPRDLWKIAGLRTQPIRYLQKQVPFFLPSGYGVAEGNGAKAPSPMKKLSTNCFFVHRLFVLSCGCGKFVKLLFCRVAVVQTCPKRNGKFFAYFGTTHIQALFLDCFEDVLCFQNKCKRRSFFRRQQTKIVKHTM